MRSRRRRLCKKKLLREPECRKDAQGGIVDRLFVLEFGAMSSVLFLDPPLQSGAAGRPIRVQVNSQIRGEIVPTSRSIIDYYSLRSMCEYLSPQLPSFRGVVQGLEKHFEGCSSITGEEQQVIPR